MFCTCEACKRARALGGKNIRTRSQAIVDNTVLIDLPPDTYLHVLREGMTIDAVESVLITHSHQDHFYPMELLMHTRTSPERRFSRSMEMIRWKRHTGWPWR